MDVLLVDDPPEFLREAEPLLPAVASSRTLRVRSLG